MKKLRLGLASLCGEVVGACMGLTINTALGRANTMVAGADGYYHSVGSITSGDMMLVIVSVTIATAMLFLAVACAINKIIEAIS